MLAVVCASACHPGPPTHMTLRRSGSWLAYVLVPTVFALLATGVTFPTEAGVARTGAAQVAEPPPAPVA